MQGIGGHQLGEHMRRVWTAVVAKGRVSALETQGREHCVRAIRYGGQQRAWRVDRAAPEVAAQQAAAAVPHKECEGHG